MGGPNPLRLEPPSEGCILAPQRGDGTAPDTQWVLAPRAQWAPLWGGREYTLERLCWGVKRIPPTNSPRVCPPPPDGPPNLGTIAGRSLPTFTDFSDFLGRIQINTFHTTIISCDHCFFFRNRPPEESDNKRSSPRRGEFDSSTPEAIGVLLGQIFQA